MSWLHRNPYRKAGACLLALFFFGSQAFSCCMVNRRMSDYLKAGLASFLPDEAAPSPHACCPSKKKTSVLPHSDHGGTKSSGCCILDAGSKLPQVASLGFIQPSFSALVIERLRTLGLGRPRAQFEAKPRLSLSDPPLYLSYLQLLI